MLIDKIDNQFRMSSTFLDCIWVYAIYDSHKQLVFMSYGLLKDIISFHPFRSNPKFIEGEIYTVVLVNGYKNKFEAERGFNIWLGMSELNGTVPPYNIYNVKYNTNKYIQCLDNGKYYKSAQDIVKIFNLPQGALSCHLRGVPGYKRVKGLSFKYVYGVQPDEVEMAGGYKWVKREGGAYATVPSTDAINRPNLTPEEIADAIERMKVEVILENGGVLGIPSNTQYNGGQS